MSTAPTTPISMCRSSYTPTGSCEHAGLFLLKAFKVWKRDGSHNDDIAAHHQQAAKISPSVYAQAYRCWKTHLIEHGDNCSHWFGELRGRLYLGLGEASPLEAGISLHHSYGMPFIPGTAIKGALHHNAIAQGMDESLRGIIFGIEPDPQADNNGTAGYVIFNDAWWVPLKGEPLTPEVVTVHHPEYYRTAGETPATDFDDPNPNLQMAIQGRFHFSFFADQSLHAVVNQLLQTTLQQVGIGAKTSSGYGLFIEAACLRRLFDGELASIQKQCIEAAKKAQMTPLELEIDEIVTAEKDNPSVALLHALEKNWPDANDQAVVAKKIMEMMKSNGDWRPNFSGKNKKRLKRKERSLKVMSYLSGDSDKFE